MVLKMLMYFSTVESDKKIGRTIERTQSSTNQLVLWPGEGAPLDIRSPELGGEINLCV